MEFSFDKRAAHAEPIEIQELFLLSCLLTCWMRVISGKSCLWSENSELST